jgi:hypothetical protein
MDVGGFAEPRKKLCQCNYQYTPGPRMGEPEFPNKDLVLRSPILHHCCRDF